MNINGCPQSLGHSGWIPHSTPEVPTSRSFTSNFNHDLVVMNRGADRFRDSALRNSLSMGMPFNSFQQKPKYDLRNREEATRQLEEDIKQIPEIIRQKMNDSLAKHALIKSINNSQNINNSSNFMGQPKCYAKDKVIDCKDNRPSTQPPRKSKEETLSKCAQEVKAQVKKTINHVGQDIASTAGKAAGVAVAGLETIVGIKKAVEDPIGAVKSVYNLATTDDKLKMADDGLAGIFAHIKLEEDKGTIPGAFTAGFEKSKLTAEVLSGIFGGIGVAKAGVSASGKIGEKLGSLFAPSPKYPTVKLADTGMKWGYPLSDQGNPFEIFVGKKFFPESTQSPDKFKVYDYFDKTSGHAVSVKTLNTATDPRLAKPNSVHDALKPYVNAIIDFKEDRVGIFALTKEEIVTRELMVGIPSQTNEAQLLQLQRTIQYGNDNGVKVTLVMVE